MGRIEKIVVLTVLFLVALILAVSLNQKSDKNNGASSSGAQTPAAGTDGKRMLDANVQPEPPAAAPNPATAKPPVDASGASSLEPKTPIGAPVSAAPKPTVPELSPAAASTTGFKTMDGLENSRFPDMYVYKWKAGDKIERLAERYLGSAKYADRLRMVNEGRNEGNLMPGETFFVPTLESIAPPTPTIPQAKPAAPGVATPAAPGQPIEKPVAKGVTEDGFYVVQKGDVLGTIAQKVYGSSKKWQKIFDANRDLLKDANALKVGMKLRIPE
jgi:nucleoid-associated protein YgaU